MLLKKFLLTSFVVVSFGLYSFHQRHGEAAPLVAPSSLNQKPTITSANTPANNSNTASSPTPAPLPAATSGYRDGQYTGNAADAFYGFIQVKTIISGGKITDVQFLQYPNDHPNSVYINKQAMPYLKQEAIAAQSSQVDIISGATDTSMAFVESLAHALSQAKI